MIHTAQTAAKRLLSEIHAPAGMVNTLVEKFGKESRIKVLVDPSYRYRLNLPRNFMGHAVVIEVREPFVAHC